MQEKIELLQKRDEMALIGGGSERIEKQHEAGKKTARERIELLLDDDTFLEFDRHVTHKCSNFGMEKKKIPGDGVVTGMGKIFGRDVFVYSQDFTVFGGSLGKMHAQKICKIMDMAVENGVPLIGISDSGGARIQEGVESLGGYADIFLRNTMASGVIPQISVIMGPCAGGAVYSPAITDFIFMVEKTSHMFVTGPDVIKTVTHEEISKEDLGGAKTHSEDSGVCHYTASSEEDCLMMVRELISFIPQNNLDGAPFQRTRDPYDRTTEKIRELIPVDSKKPYDVKEIISEIVDDGDFFEAHQNFAGNIVVGFSRLGGQTVGVVANQPMILAGCLDISASVKSARFVRFCDAFQIPLLTLVDVPGFLPGSEQEIGGIIRHGAKLLYAYAEATVPKVTLITRKAYGGAYDVMASKHIRADVNFAYPTAEIAVMGAEGAVNIIYRNEIKEAKDKEKRRAELIKEYEDSFANPYKAAEVGYIDRVIDPIETRKNLIKSFALLKGKRQSLPAKKHGNIPL